MKDAGESIVAPGEGWATNRIQVCCCGLVPVLGQNQKPASGTGTMVSPLPSAPENRLLSGTSFTSLRCEVGALYSENLHSIFR